MRQKGDVEFANLLDRVRTAEHTEEDIRVLQLHTTDPSKEGYPIDALHVFPFNKQVDAHNQKMLATLESQPRLLEAIVCYKDLQTGSASLSIPDKPSETGGYMNENDIMVRLISPLPFEPSSVLRATFKVADITTIIDVTTIIDAATLTPSTSKRIS